MTDRPMVSIDAKKILEERLASSMGLDKYSRIMQNFNKVDVSIDKDFQREFNGFYIVRRNAEWRKIYYDLFEGVKTEDATFSKIITHLFERTGNIEASFSSKILATMYSDRPIWDQYVVRNLNLKLTGKTKQETLNNAIKLYSDIEDWYYRFLQTEDAKECIAVFNSMLPKYSWVSDLKKVDFFLWSIR